MSIFNQADWLLSSPEEQARAIAMENARQLAQDRYIENRLREKRETP